MKKLRISTELQLPADEAVTRSFGILGMRGSGKSNAAVVMAEEMFRAGLHWVAIDPKGDWWGIRAGKDGKAGGGLPVVIFGGEHADVPLEPTPKAGVLVADLILNEGITCVLDLSEFTKAGKVAFLAGPFKEEGFAGRLFRKKRRDQDPIHLFLEEAHDYVPQQAKGDVAKMVDAISNLQTMGRTKGLGCSILSQRSARVHKDVLTQVDTLLVFRTVGPQDVKAIADWVKYHGAGEELLASLATLSAGESWLWSPEWLGVMKRIHWRQRETFDSGATPTTATTRRSPATLADVDLEAVSAQMKETIERAKADDPKELRRQLAEANRRLRELEARPAVAAEPERIEVPVEVRVEVPVFPEETLRRVEALVEKSAGPMFELLSEAQELAGTAKHGRDRLYQLLDEAKAKTSGPARPAGALPTSPSPAPARTRGQAPKVPDSSGRQPLPRPRAATRDVGAAPAPSVDGDPRPTGPEQRILDSLAWWEAVGIRPASRLQVAFVANYHPRTKALLNGLGSLRTAGLIDYPEPGMVELSDHGRALADAPFSPPSTAELQRRVSDQIGPKLTRLLAPVITSYPDAWTRDQLAEGTGYHPRTKAFLNGLGRLRSLGLVEYPRPGEVAATSLLFLE